MKKQSTIVKLTPAQAAQKHKDILAAQKQAQIDAAKDIAQADAAATPEATPEATATPETKPARIPRQKPANKPPVVPIKAAETAPATDNKPKVEKTVEPSAKEKKQAARVEYIRKAADILVKSHFANSANELTIRTSANEVQKSDFVVYHSAAGFYQILYVEYISDTKTILLHWAQDDAKNVKAGSAGAWTKESWDIDRIQNVFSKRGGHDKFLQVVFFGKK